MSGRTEINNTADLMLNAQRLRARLMSQQRIGGSALIDDVMDVLDLLIESMCKARDCGFADGVEASAMKVESVPYMYMEVAADIRKLKG